MTQQEMSAKIELLKFLAYKREPASSTEIREVIKPHISKSATQSAFIDMLCDDGEIRLVPTRTTAKNYIISTDKALELLWDVTLFEAKEYNKIIDKFTYRYPWEKKRLGLPEFLVTWHDTGDIASYNWRDVETNGYIRELALAIPLHSKWCNIIKFFNDTHLIHIAEECHEFYSQLLNVEFTKRFQEHIVSKTMTEVATQETIWAMDQLYTNIYTGKLREVTYSDYDSSHNLALRAITHQYAGQHAKAVTLYRKVIKEEETDSEFTSNPLLTLLFIKALEKDKKQSSVNRLDKVYKYARYAHSDKQMPAALYLTFINEHNVSQHINTINTNHLSLTPLELVVSVIIALHYKMGEISNEVVDLCEEIINRDEFLLLQLEASSSLPKYIAKREELLKKLDLTPILEPFTILEPWEKSLNEFSSIIESIGVKKVQNSSVSTENSRIIYHLDRHDNFQPRLQKRLANGSWSKGRNVALSTLATNSSEGMTSVDQVVASCVKCYDTWSGRTYSLSGNSVFKALINHPLVFSSENPDLAISIESDTPHLRVENHKGGYRVSSNLKLDGVNNTVVKRESDVSYRVFSLTTPQRRIIDLFEKQSQYPASARELLSQLIVSAASIITVHSDIVAKNDNLKVVKSNSRITVQLIPISDGLKMELFVKPIEEVSQYLKPAKGEESIIALHNGESVLVERSLKKEAKNLMIVKEAITQSTSETNFDDVIIFDDIYDALEMIEALQELEKIARIEWPKGAKLKVRGAVDFDKLNLSLRSKMGWFEVEGNIKVDRDLQMTLAELLERLRSSKGRFVELTKGEFISLSESLRKQLSELEAASSQGKKGIQISKFASSVMNDLESGGAKISKDKAFEELQKRIMAAENTTIKVPSTLQAELRDYQVDGYKWMARLAEWGAGACLADDMGLGKTVQSIALLLNRAEQGASLIVAPASVVHNWQSELQRFAPTLKCRILHDNIAEREEIINSAAPFDVVITTYGLLGRVTDLITPKSWNVILLDEAHNIKNRDTKSSKVAMNLNGQFRLMLTGTPIQNHLGEIWNLFNFTNPGLLGSFDHFATKFINPIEQSNDKVRQRELKRILQPFMLRRTKSEVLDELPTKTEIIHRVELSEAERAIYENIRESAVQAMESGALNPIQSLAEITKLRQAACHPALINESLQLQSAKVARFTEIATELIQNRHRALVFSQFTSFLSLIKKALDEKGIPYLYLDGSTPIKEREKLVNGFQQGSTPLFLISLKAGGTGLNLTAADYVIHLDPWWNPAIEDQASDRSHRIGQTRAVTIYRLIAQDTIEEKIIELHKNKKSLADSLLEGSNMSHKLSREDMIALLRSQH